MDEWLGLFQWHKGTVLMLRGKLCKACPHVFILGGFDADHKHLTAYLIHCSTCYSQRQYYSQLRFVVTCLLQVRSAT